MYFVRTEDLKAGMRLAGAVYDKQGEILYERDSKLTGQEITNIKNLGYIGFFVLESAEPAPPMTEEEIELDCFWAMTVFSIQEELESISKNTKAVKTDSIVSGIIKQYGHLDGKISFHQQPRSKGDYLFKHAMNTAALCAIITNRLNLKVEERRETVTAALAHDVGKLELEAHIINKTELSESEAGLVHFKVVEGFERIKEVYSNGSVIRRICEQAEEALYTFRQGQFDRKQFEKSTQKYMGSRVLVVAEVYDSMTAMQDGKAPESGVKTIKYLRDHSEIFDSRVGDALCDSLNILSAGISVELNTGDKALVITENERNILRPMILCFKDNMMMDLSNREYDDIEIIDVAKTMDNRHVMKSGSKEQTKEQNAGQAGA